MIDIIDTTMYLRYYKKQVYLMLLKYFTGLDFTGRVENSNKKLRGYEGCYPVGNVLRKINITDADSVLDIGCGKGLFLYYATKYKFKRIDGIEYSEDLVKRAKTNSTIIGDDRIHIYHADARSFSHFGDYNCYFINNPFDAEILEQVLKAILHSHNNDNETITVIYQFPFNRDTFDKCGFKVVYDRYPNLMLTLL